MTLLQIHEPGQTPAPHEDENKIAVGIDLGTTNSLVAVSDGQKPRIIKDSAGNAIHPSVVAYNNDGTIKTGYIENGDEIISSVKRLMGRGVEDIKRISNSLPFEIAESEGIIKLQISEKQLTPIEISSEILKSLKKIAEDGLGQEVNQAVITVPAYFDDAARAATKDAAKLAGWHVLRLINEPTAAALAYGLDKQAKGTYAIYDLGGGTFDITILKMEKGIFRVLSTGGSTEIGGDDFDREITEKLIWNYKIEQNDPKKLSKKDLQNVLKVARKAKEHLSNNEEGKFDIVIDRFQFLSHITKEEFEQTIMPYIDATIELSRQALDDANVTEDEIDGVVLVGGSTRVPLVKEKIEEFFGNKPLSDINPDEVVASGAAIQAEGLTRGSDNLLLDVLPLSLGIETMGEIVEKVIHRNTPIPVAKAQEFTTHKDNQTGMKIHVVQGEREIVSQNRSLAKFELKGIPPMVAGAARVKVTFSVDADGLLTVSAKEESTGAIQKVEVQPSYGLTDDEIKDMLYNSMANAKSDMEARLLSEAKIEAEGTFDYVSNAIEQDGNLLSNDEKIAIEEALNKLEKVIQSCDREEINNIRKEVEKITENFASLRMDKYVGSALKGKDIR